MGQMIFVLQWLFLEIVWWFLEKFFSYLKFGVWKRVLKIAPKLSSLQPIVVSQNCSSATSAAKLAPIKTAIGMSKCCLIVEVMSWIPPAGKISKPLTKEIPITFSFNFPFNGFNERPMNWCGMTTMRISASLAASRMSGTAKILGGNLKENQFRKTAHEKVS